jgi:hypothetical protein
LVAVDFLHHSASYTPTTEITDSNSKKTTISEATRATYWDIPVRLQVLSLPRLPRRMFVSGGGVLRHAGHIRTGNEFTYHDGSTDYNEWPTKPAKNPIWGVVVGAGFRFVDDFNIKVMPEVRYTRWFGSTYNSASTLSQQGQLEALIGITF